jgi:predicted  nucleic acid-binding Zn-ribbon protein
MAEAEARAKEYEETSSKLWLALDRAGIDVEETVARPAPRQRPVFVSGLSISQGGGALDPEVEAIQRKLMEADDDLSELMNEIMTDMVKVETEVARKELEAARAEAEELRRRLADRGYNPAQ